MPVKIVTDSTCDLPTEAAARLGVTVVPLYIHLGNQDYADGIDITREEFYRKLALADSPTTTAVPSLTKFTAIYRALVEEGASEILSIHISESLSAVVNVARSAAAEFQLAPVTVFDSRSLSMGIGFLVQTAAEMAAAGKTAAEIVQVLENQIRRTHVWAALDTLQYLRKSGRMSRALSVVGELLQIKPILKMHDGVSSVERVRTKKAAIARLAEVLESAAPFEKLAFLHSNALEQMQGLRTRVQQLIPENGSWIGVVNPVLGAHIGPGVVGFAYVRRE